VDVKCPRCNEEMQFPFMVCPDCRWKPKEYEIGRQEHYAHLYIEEHPDERDQLKMVLDMVMEEKVQQAKETEKRKRRSAAMVSKIKVWHIIVSGIFGSVWILFGALVLISGSEEDPVMVNGDICYVMILSMVSFLVFIVLFLVKIIDKVRSAS
jgi:hypothetical protein